MITQNLLSQISEKLVMLARLSISDSEKSLVNTIINTELNGFDALDIMKVFFINKGQCTFPSLFLALKQFWSGLDFQNWLSVIRELDGNLDGLVSWVFFSGQYMGIDGLKAALDSDLLSLGTKTSLKRRLPKGTPQPLKRHLTELAAWNIDFDTIHQRMVQTGGPLIPANHDYYQQGPYFNE